MAFTITIIFSLFILPVVLIYFKVIPFRYKVHVLCLVSVIAAVIMIFQKWTLIKLGLKIDLVSEYFTLYFLFTLVLVFLLIIVAKLQRKNFKSKWWRDNHFLYGFILVSIFQEFLFRGFLIPQLEGIFKPYIIVILINASLFAFMHLIYANDTQSMVMIFIGGVCFATMYVYFPSLILIIISHAILNFIAVLFGFYSKERPQKNIIDRNASLSNI